MTFSERIRSLWKLLLLPADRRVTNKRRRGFFLLLACVLSVCTSVLTLLCFSLGAALNRADWMTAGLTAYFSAAGEDAAVFTSAVQQIIVGRARAIMLTVISMVVWLICAVVAVGIVGWKEHSKLFTIEREDSVLFCDVDSDVRYDGA